MLAVAVVENRASSRITADLRLTVHERSGFLEMIVVDSVEDAAGRRFIRELPAATSHQGIRRVQTTVISTG